MCKLITQPNAIPYNKRRTKLQQTFVGSVQKNCNDQLQLSKVNWGQMMCTVNKHNAQIKNKIQY